MPFYFAVTGLHDMDEFVQSQLILAVNYGSLYSFQCEKYVIDPNLEQFREYLNLKQNSDYEYCRP